MSSLIRYEEPVYALTDLVDEFFNGGFFPIRRATSGVWPKVDIVENEDHYTIHAELPGISKSDVKMTVENGVLTIKGEKKEEKKEEKKNRYYYYERSFGSFERSFYLPENVEEKNIEAKYNNGVLEVILKKTEKEKPKALEIKVD